VRLLDLFCGAGGAAMGYHRAGFEVVGVDIVRQYDYPFDFVLGDADTFALDGFDAIHASPPCKLFTGARGDRHALRLFDPHVDHLTPMLNRLAEIDVPWIVENVPGAPMPDGSVMLCGSSFGLDVRRHRLFASNRPLTAPPCDHDSQAPGRYPSLDNENRKAGILAAVVGVHGAQQYNGHHADACAAMGIDWMPWEQLTQAIPPVYTEHLGRQLVEVLA
jgi:DNA (cytosine-5)-methyltransferase 1